MMIYETFILSCCGYLGHQARHMLATYNDGKMTLEEVYRFENGMDDDNGKKTWDTDRLFKEIISGMIQCKKIGKVL